MSIRKLTIALSTRQRFIRWIALTTFWITGARSTATSENAVICHRKLNTKHLIDLWVVSVFLYYLKLVEKLGSKRNLSFTDLFLLPPPPQFCLLNSKPKPHFLTFWICVYFLVNYFANYPLAFKEHHYSLRPSNWCSCFSTLYTLLFFLN